MKRIVMGLMGLASVLPIWGRSDKGIVEKIEPPYWWAGMEERSLQLMVYGKNIKDADVSLDYDGAKIDSIVRPDSPNYLFVYLDIDKSAKPGEMPLRFVLGKRSQTVNYELKGRTQNREDYNGFDTSDVLYLIMPDRFAVGKIDKDASAALKYEYEVDRGNPHARHGGNIAGIETHLDYIDSLGVTAVWVNPVLENDIPGGSYHGYATTNYYKIDPRLGSNTDWRNFVESAHKRNIKVVMDMIFNHCGVTHPWISDVPMHDWINFPDHYVETNHRLSAAYDLYVSEYDKRKALDGWFVPGMPDLNQRNPHLMKYLIQNSIWWIEDSKIDGIRMDTHPYADSDAMASWIRAVEREYPNFNIVGECWYANEGSSAFWQKNSKVNPVDPELPTVMDFVITTKGREAFNEKTKDRDGLNKMYDHLAMDFLFPDPSRILTFLDNHDTDRFLTEMPENLDKWKQAQAFLLTTRGIPQIYYGTEILMHGTRAEGGDGMIRLDMPGGFPGDENNVLDGSGMTSLQKEAFDFLSELLHFRRGNKAISEGALKHFVPEGGVYTYERKAADDRVVVIMNGTDEPVIKDMTQTLEILPLGSRLKDVISDKEIVITQEMEFEPRALYILKDIV